MKKKGVIFLGILLVFTFIFASCTSYRPVDVTNTQAAQINQVNFHDVQPGERVNTMYINRTGSFINDLNKVKNGSWYGAHRDLIVSVEAVLKNGKKAMWRIEYVD
ncbi:MAG: hypothetical protein LBI14_10345 [Treponema sp.]|jgi:hypothetical protein|nr:hypothetical protein [Treponema sp.]